MANKVIELQKFYQTTNKPIYLAHPRSKYYLIPYALGLTLSVGASLCCSRPSTAGSDGCCSVPTTIALYTMIMCIWSDRKAKYESSVMETANFSISAEWKYAASYASAFSRTFCRSASFSPKISSSSARW
ncbi:hypothetical protein OGATHE_001222 [Ogataea polymorpha]|uniref:Uncharacterized protein n=1 Tax=Ogataea polymorpha TaxID=460523 RepID=A0A9P8PRE7_9ASCO|nr:hypothetical protein OGATHE_001222 [Ogataea polymorpha]